MVARNCADCAMTALMISNDEEATADVPACRWKSALAAVIAVTLLAAGAILYHGPAARYVAVDAAWNTSAPQPASWNASAQQPAAEDTAMLQDAGMDILAEAGGVHTHLGLRHSGGDGQADAKVVAVLDPAAVPQPAPIPKTETVVSSTFLAAPPDMELQQTGSSHLDAASQPDGSQQTDEAPQSGPGTASQLDGPGLPDEVSQPVQSSKPRDASRFDESPQPKTSAHQKTASGAGGQSQRKESQERQRPQDKRKCRLAEEADRQEVRMSTPTVSRSSMCCFSCRVRSTTKNDAGAG